MESLLKVAFTERCKRPSCTTGRSSGSDYCKSHTRKTNPCKEPGCKFLEYTGGYCRTHGGKKCTIPGCTNVAGVGKLCMRHYRDLPPRTLIQEGQKKSSSTGKHTNYACSVPMCTKKSPTLGGFCHVHRRTTTDDPLSLLTTALQMKKEIPKKKKRKTCTFQGCTNISRIKGGLCRTHGGKTCALQDCSNLATMKGGLCTTHGMKCSVPECTKASRSGVGGTCRFHSPEGGRKRKLDDMHILDTLHMQPQNMHNIHNIQNMHMQPQNMQSIQNMQEPFTVKKEKKMCSIPGCPSLVKRRGLCRTHGGVKCKHQDCPNLATVGGGMCTRHGGYQCAAQGCTKISRAGRGEYCAEHAAVTESEIV